MNPHRGEHALEAEGKTYTLRFSTNALCELEAIDGRPASEILSDLNGAKTVRLALLRALLWAALQDRHQGLSLGDAGTLIDTVTPTKALEAIAEALRSAYPKEAAAPAADKRPRKGRQ